MVQGFRLHQEMQNRLHVARKADGAWDVLVDLRRVDVDMDERRALHVLDNIARLAVSEATAERNDDIGFGNRMIRRLVSMHAGKADAQGMRLRQRTKTHQGLHDRDAVVLSKSGQLFRGSCIDDAAARDDDGLSRLPNRFRRLRRTYQEVRVGFSGRLLLIDAAFVLHVGKEEVSRNVDEHRPGSAAARDVKRFAQGRYEFRRVLDLEIVLRHRHRDAEDVRFLKGVAPQKPRIDLPCDCYHGDGIHERRGDSRHEIRRARPRCRKTDADLARRTRIAIGGVRCALLVRGDDLTNISFIVKRIVERQVHAARIAEDRVDALLLQTFDNCFRASHAKPLLS